MFNFQETLLLMYLNFLRNFFDGAVEVRYLANFVDAAAVVVIQCFKFRQKWHRSTI